MAKRTGKVRGGRAVEQKRKKTSSARSAKSASAPKKSKPSLKARNATKDALRRSTMRRALRVVGILLVLFVLFGGGGFIYVAHDLPSTDDLSGPAIAPSMTVLASDGSVLARQGERWGNFVRLAEMSPLLPQAVIAVEDRRFYEHGAIDMFGLARALWRNLTSGRVVEGGSTISQQLAKILFLTPERTLKRKAQEAILAFWLERKFSKDQVLTIYLNRVYLGAGTYGVDAASTRYFDKGADALSLPEAAMIAGLLKAPSRLSPATNLAGARARAAVVLGTMVAAEFITNDDAQTARRSPAKVATAPPSVGEARYFVDWIVDQVQGYVGAGHAVLTVQTTLHPKMQALAEGALRAELKASGASANIGQGALVVMDPNGAVRAMVGGRSYAQSQFNRVAQAMRQPGSAFKPVVYLTAFEAGHTPDDVMEDKPLSIDDWSPENYDSQYHGAMSLREAFARSINTIAVRLTLEAGPAIVARTASRLGIARRFPGDASIALGTADLTLLDLTGAYASIAANGERALPFGIVEVVGRGGDVLYRRAGSGLGAMFEATSVRAIQSVLASAVTDGTGKAAVLPDQMPAAHGKTGTSQNYRDAWFVGYAGNVVAGVWLGNDDASSMKGVTGGGAPARAWRRFMMGLYAP